MTEPTIPFSWDSVVRNCGLLAKTLHDTGAHFKMVIGVKRGGIIPATLISRFLGVNDLQFIDASSYNAETNTQTEKVDLTWNQKVIDKGALLGHQCIVVDDILDTGKTFEAISQQLLPEATYAAMVGKRKTFGEGFMERQAYTNFMPTKNWFDFPWEVTPFSPF